MNLEELRKEEKELEELVYGKKEENPSEEALETEEVEEETLEEDSSEDLSHSTDSDFTSESDSQEEDEQDSSQRTQRVNWKKRFTNYKASTDNTIFNLRREISALKEQTADLIKINKDMRKMIESNRVDPIDSVISEDDEELIGPEAADIVKRAVKAATEPLQEKIRQLQDAEEQKVIKEAANARESNISNLKQKLSGIVENFEAIDTDPKFGKYLEAEDEYSGVPRKTLFSRAIKNGDIRRVADFYKDFASKRPQRKEEILGKKISPIGKSSENSEVSHGNKKKVYTMQEYNETYDRYLRGGFKNENEKKTLIEKMKLLDLAFVEGRIR